MSSVFCGLFGDFGSFLYENGWIFDKVPCFWKNFKVILRLWTGVRNEGLGTNRF